MQYDNDGKEYSVLAIMLFSVIARVIIEMSAL